LFSSFGEKVGAVPDDAILANATIRGLRFAAGDFQSESVSKRHAALQAHRTSDFNLSAHSSFCPRGWAVLSLFLRKYFAPPRLEEQVPVRRTTGTCLGRRVYETTLAQVSYQASACGDTENKRSTSSCAY
jgi:hypothetical protein